MSGNQALILVGGKGKRLFPYTNVFPKPMMPIGDMPLLEITIRRLKNQGFTNIILAVGYMHQIIEAYFQDGRKWGVNIQYSLEETPLGTAGPIGLLEDKLQNNFLVMNGDLLTTFSFRNIYNYHMSKMAAAVMAIRKESIKIESGVITVFPNGMLDEYKEKPILEMNFNIGINVFNKESVFRILQKNQYMDIPDVMKRLRDVTVPSVYCYEEECKWIDVGIINDYQKSTEIFEQFIDEFLPTSQEGSVNDKRSS